MPLRAGKIASVLLVLIVTTVATAVRIVSYQVFGLESSPPSVRVLIFVLVVCGVSAAILIPIGAALDSSLAGLRREIKNGLTHDRTFVAIRYRWLRPVANALTEAAEQFREREAGLRTQVNDIEIRLRVAEAHRRKIEAVLHALRDPVIVTDPFNEIIMANDAAGRVLNFNPADVIGRPIERVIANQSLQRVINEARHSIDFVHPKHVELEVGAGDTNDSRAANVDVFDVCIHAVANQKSELGAIVTILHNLTRERELSRMKSDFVSKASHELRTPLSSIRAYVEMLVDGELDQDQQSAEAQRQEFYRVIHNETERLGRLIDNMLNISRIEAGIVQVHREVVDMGAIIERAVQTIGPQATEKQLSIHTRLEGESLLAGGKLASNLTVEGDSDMLYQVVLNLLSNAVKYTPEGGRITVSADTDGIGTKRDDRHQTKRRGHPTVSGGADVTTEEIMSSCSRGSTVVSPSVVVSVADTGLGIPPEAMPRMFEKFYRIDNYKRMAKGTGLGLNLCQQIVETAHGGQLGVESQLGMGSKFWFAIPMKYSGKKAA